MQNIRYDLFSIIVTNLLSARNMKIMVQYYMSDVIFLENSNAK